MNGRSRVQPGVPAGGQFAAHKRAEVDVRLLDPQYRHPPKLAQAPEPEPELAPPVPEPEGGPAPGTLRPSEIIDWPTNNKRRVAALKETMSAVDELHGIVDNGFKPTRLVLGSNKGGGKGGHFGPEMPPGPKPRRARGEDYADYRERRRQWHFAERSPEIRINARDGNDGEEQFFMLHELGHRMDASPTDLVNGYKKSSFHSEHAYELMTPEAKEAFVGFMEAAVETPNIKNAYMEHPGAFARYHRDVKEIWARAYCQWATNKIGGPARQALTTFQGPGTGRTQWEDDEFEALVPHVENVLRATGVMK